MLKETGCVLGVILVIFLWVFWLPWGTVNTGERGVRTKWSAVTGEIISEGFYFRNPFIDNVIKINVQTQKVEIDADGASKDLQTVVTKIAVNYNVEPSKVVELYQKTGLDYQQKVMIPTIEESVKAVTAQYTADQLITMRNDVNGKIYESIKSELISYGITVQQLNIVNFNFSASFNQAIEAKVTAEQNALAAKNKLQQVQFEAEQRVAEAKGKAEAITVESNALRNNPDVLELRALEKWNGVLPQVTSGAVPFINLEK